MENKKTPVEGYYYSKSEWDRLGCGPLPPERNRDLKQVIEKSVEDKEDTGKGYN